MPRVNINDVSRDYHSSRAVPPNLRAVKTGQYSEIAASNPGGGPPLRASQHLGPGALRIQARQIVNDFTRYTEASIKLTILESLELLIEDTPKDTSWASISWFPGYGEAFDNGGYLIDPGIEFEPEEYGDSLLEAEDYIKLSKRRTEQKNAISAFAKTRIFVNQFVARAPEITNNVPYIEELNEGKSDQIEAGYVPKAIQRGLNRLELRANTFAFAGGRRVRFI